MQHGASRLVLSQRSVNVMHVNRTQPTSEPKFLDARPNSKHNAGILFVLVYFLNFRICSCFEVYAVCLVHIHCIVMDIGVWVMEDWVL